ncbi:ribosomal protein L10e/L16 [Kockovaella imperatae]|uniref:Ribosomal protein L10e/L16 n=1 Tax=Kockovaella imperatae TaxID=4999 RepID=A0A1Y1UAP7_9TREE|nr:ribosomal protein L10e/L16 [Kockovaella imperatae]ORX35099.1 ribosomal protein L10e/L16 [Kockovaella imperatae]
MLSYLRQPFTSLASIAQSSFASSSRTRLPPLASSSSFNRISFPALERPQTRGLKQVLAPRRTKHRKSQKGLPIHLPIGGSIRGTTVKFGNYGLRILESHRLSAAVLHSCRESLRKKLKPVKGFKLYLRVFPDIPICVKGNEVRMGKGKGAFEFWACRVPAGRVIWEIGAPGGMPEQVAKAALKLIQVKLPVRSEIISRSSPPRLGTLVSHDLQDLRTINLIPVDQLPPPPGTHYRKPTVSSMSLLSAAAESTGPQMVSKFSTAETLDGSEESEEDQMKKALLLAEEMGGEIETEAQL